MNAAIGVHEAEAHLGPLLDRVAGGETIVITRQGKPVARLVPEVGTAAKLTVQEAIDEMNELRKGNRLDGVTIRELIEEGRRY